MIIGINGQKRSGKDTLASIIRDIDTNNTFIYKFAAPIKEGLLIGLSEYGYEYKDIDGQDGFDREEKLFSFDETVEVIMKACLYCNVKADYDYVYFCLLPHEGNFSIRDMMQMLGTDIARSIDDQHWIKYADKKYNEMLFNNSDLCFIITDVRFDNELQMVVDNKGHVLQVNRANALEPNHISDELTHIECAIQIDNNGSLEDLTEQFIKLQIL